MCRNYKKKTVKIEKIIAQTGNRLMEIEDWQNRRNCCLVLDDTMGLLEKELQNSWKKMYCWN